MVGFMKKPLGFAGGGIGSLGFASGVGAAIGGAARQENLNIEAQAAQDRQQDIIDQSWAAKTDQAAKDYKSQQGMYNSIYAITGDAKQADMVMSMLPKNAKMTDIQAAIGTVKNNVPTDSNYQSQFMQQRFQDLQKQYNNLPPKYQRQLGDINSLNPNQQGQSPSPFNPQQMQTPSGVTQGNPSSQSPIPQPKVVDDSYMAQRAGVPTTDNPNTPSGATNSPGVQGSGQPITPQQYGRPYIAPNTSKPMTPYEQQRIDLENQRLIWQKSQKPASADEQAGLAIMSDDLKKYLHDPKTGLQARYADLSSIQNQNFDMGSMLDIMQRGFKANAVQPAYDELNRFTTSLLGVSLSDMGISNNVSDVNLLKKDIANGVIDRLKTLHFGRITNYEAQTVRQGFANTGNDPNTNLKIVLIAKSLIQESAQAIKQEYDSVYKGGSLPTGLKDQATAVASGRQAVRNIQNKFDEQGDTAPWPQVTNMNQVAKIPDNQWFEDKSDPVGTMYIKVNGKLKRAGDNING